MRLSDYARRNGIQYKTAWLHFHRGLIPGARQLPTGTIIIDEPTSARKAKTVIYARVSSSEQRDDLKRQAERCVQFANANGWQVEQVVTEIGFGLNDERRKLLAVLRDDTITRLVIEHKDRLTRFGFNYVDILCDHIGCELVVINQVDTDEQDLIQDFVSVITSFCARIYGRRRSRRKTERLIEELRSED